MMVMFAERTVEEWLLASGWIITSRMSEEERERLKNRVPLFHIPGYVSEFLEKGYIKKENKRRNLSVQGRKTHSG